MAKALGAMNPKQLWGFVPLVFPMTNRHPIYQVLARFPVDEWTRAGAPYLSTKGWCKFCIILSENNREGLKDVFEVATKELEACQKREAKIVPLHSNRLLTTGQRWWTQPVRVQLHQNCASTTVEMMMI